MTDNDLTEKIVRMRMHGLYLSRKCNDIVTLAHELLGLHCWFHRNVCFSALIRGSDVYGWKTALTKTWLYRGTLHGVSIDDLPQLLALHADDMYLSRYYDKALLERIMDEVVRYMEDGVYSRAEFRRIYARELDPKMVEAMFSPWGGVFVYLARRGRVAFQDMTSRDFDLISAEPTQTVDEVLPELLHRYFISYGPATLSDAAWFFGFWKDDAKKLRALPLDEYSSFKLGGKTYYYVDNDDACDIPELTLLSGFDPLIVSYTERGAVLPEQYKSRVILKSGICLPTIAVNGRVVGMWNIKNNQPVVEFFENQPGRLERAASELVDSIHRRARL